jgi:hypothetical protein
MAVSQVLFLRAQTMPISHSRCNHMTISHEDRSIRLVHFPQDGAPTKVWVARSWGLPVPFLMFPEEFVTVALSGYSKHIHQGLSIISPPSAVQTAAHLCRWHEHSGHLSTGRAWTFLNSCIHEPRLLTISCLFFSTTIMNISCIRDCGH